MRLGNRGRAGRGAFALSIRRQSGLSRGVKYMLVTGMTVTTLLTSVATGSAQNFFEALFGRPKPAPRAVPNDPNFTARDRQTSYNRRLATAARSKRSAPAPIRASWRNLTNVRHRSHDASANLPSRERSVWRETRPCSDSKEDAPVARPVGADRVRHWWPQQNVAAYSEKSARARN